MDIHCTRPKCQRPINSVPELDSPEHLKTTSQKFCTCCGMPLILAGRYLPQRLLGQGGFGAAYLAVDRYTPTLRSCVVKQFQPAGQLSEQQLAISQQHFEQEALVLEELGNEHPQIPRLYAFFPLLVPSSTQGEESQFFYLVQEWIDGQNLEEELEYTGTFSEQDILTLLRQILPVLQFIHDRHTIHRDIKPSNIMRDKKGRLVLLDFGAVKQISQGSGGRSTEIYSQGFAPPEQMAGGQVYPSTDLYALAVTCLILLTQKESQDLYDSYNNRWNWRSEIELSEPLASALDKMLALSPYQRFGSANEVLAFLRSQSIQSMSPSTTLQSPAASGKLASAATPAQPLVKTLVFSTPELLSISVFTGFESVVLALGLTNLLGVNGISMGIWGAAMGGLVYAQFRRWIERMDLVILAVISWGILLFVPPVRGTHALDVILIIPVCVGAGLGLIMSVFRLISQKLVR
ncbi:MAG: serine/threonine protein kinase [Roseofilum sp. Belize BBD 4]|uniref:serine/threonine-protein kinase n=1 Tax=Roseofilum sp. Belize BBD 4 TaxID=2821500 RepID=UPI000E9B4EC6|nr:serine/threonine-protein kinase [Roseofilum sp. Belize BBD 4]MBP0032608.1 serine/threonine protein kinase [Roseofilum sp. Belize BBD 4]HBQ97153.1 serine/threonine protein kinase [Cyanobacteria bacterium UBA11691]